MTTSLNPRPRDLEFQNKLKALCDEFGISHHVFVGEFKESEVQHKDRAVTSFSGHIEKTLRLVDALNDIVPEIIIRGLAQEIGPIIKRTCEDCPDREECNNPLKDGRRECNA